MRDEAGPVAGDAPRVFTNAEAGGFTIDHPHAGHGAVASKLRETREGLVDESLFAIPGEGDRRREQPQEGQGGSESAKQSFHVCELNDVGFHICRRTVRFTRCIDNRDSIVSWYLAGGRRESFSECAPVVATSNREPC